MVVFQSCNDEIIIKTDEQTYRLRTKGIKNPIKRRFQR